MAVDPAITIVASVLGVTFVLGTIAVVICCLCCWKKKPRQKTPQQNNNVQEGQAYVVPPQTSGGAVVINPPAGQGPSIVVPSIMPPMGPHPGLHPGQPMGPHSGPHPGNPMGPRPGLHPGQPMGPHPGHHTGQPMGPHPGPHPGQPMGPHPGPHRPTYGTASRSPPRPAYGTASRSPPRPAYGTTPWHAAGWSSRMPVQQPGGPRGPRPVDSHSAETQQAANNKAKTLPQSKKKFENLEKRRSVTDNQYLRLNVPASQDTPGMDVEHQPSLNPKIQEMAGILAAAIARNLESISIDASRIARKDVLGSGQYGVVYKGELANADKSRASEVALKTIAGDASDKKILQDFMEEVLRMKTFNHPHVMPMLGMAFMEEKPYMVLPFMENGDLRSYIANPKNTFLVEDLLRFIQQVAKGMDYLSQQSIIHGDLAARNCMVDQKCAVKVADFGLSRHLCQSNYYSLMSSEQARPVRWMAPECMDSERKMYTIKSDVWAYGILLWEVMTRGLRPYPDMKSNEAVIIHVQKGYRMPCPEYTATEIYGIMTHCWSTDAANRPSFKDLIDITSLIIEQGEGDYERPVQTSM